MVLEREGKENKAKDKKKNIKWEDFFYLFERREN